MARHKRHARHVLALCKGVSTVGTPYSAGTPILHLSSDACTGQSYTLTDDDARMLLAKPAEQFHHPDFLKNMKEKAAATMAKRRSIYKVVGGIRKALASVGKKIERKRWNGDQHLTLCCDMNVIVIFEGRVSVNNTEVDLHDPECFNKLIKLLK